MVECTFHPCGVLSQIYQPVCWTMRICSPQQVANLIGYLEPILWCPHVSTLAPSASLGRAESDSDHRLKVCSYLADGRGMSRSPSPDYHTWGHLVLIILLSLRFHFYMCSAVVPEFCCEHRSAQFHRNSICGVGLIIFLIKAWADGALVKVLCKNIWNVGIRNFIKLSSSGARIC